MKNLLLISLFLLTHNSFGEETEKQKSEGFWDYISIQATLKELSFKEIDNDFEFDWELEVSNTNRDKFEYDLSYEHKYDKQVSSFDSSQTTELEVDIDAEVDINRVWGILGITSSHSFTQKKQNDVYESKYDISASVGIKLDFIENDTITELSLSYLPAYNYLERFDQDTDFDTGAIILEKFIERSLQHEFRFNFSGSFFNEKFQPTFQLSWKEIKPFDKTIADQRDFVYDSELQLSYSPIPWFSFGYNNQINVDESRKGLQQLPSTDIKHAITFSLNWN